MQFEDLKLPAFEFKEAPTKTQIVNTLRDIHKFLNRLGGALILDGSYTVGDEPIGLLLNGSIQMRAAADKFEAGPNSSGIAVPQPHPGPQRMR